MKVDEGWRKIKARRGRTGKGWPAGKRIIQYCIVDEGRTKSGT